MKVEHCPALGDYCITAHSRPHFDSDKNLYPKELLMSQPVPTGATAAIYSLDAHIQSLQESGRALRRLSGHPAANRLIGIRSDAIQNLEVVSVRLEKKQRDCLDPTLDATAKNEAELALQTLDRMMPLAAIARRNELTAEALVDAISQEPDPALARQQFIAQGKNFAAVYDDDRVLLAPTPHELPKRYNATKTYTFRVKVSQLNLDSGTATFVLIEAFGDQPFFGVHENDHHIKANIPDHRDRMLVGLCASFGISAAINVALSVDIGKKGFQFAGTVISFFNETDLHHDIRRAMMEQTMELFKKDE
jgi:hypothetical protein